MRYSALLLLAGLIATPALQADVKTDPKAPVTAVTTVNKELAEVAKAIEIQLKSRDPNIPIERVERTDWKGVYMIVLSGGNVIYASSDGRLILRGDMLKLEDDGNITNLTENVRTTAIAKQLAQLKPADTIAFKPKGNVKGVVYAFTDVDCGYCRKLHQELQAMNDLGIELRYLAFPRGGDRSPAYQKMVSAWCSKDRKQAITDLKTGKEIPITDAAKKGGPQPAGSCGALVDEQYQLGINLGVNGTPALFLEDGRSIPGYRPASELAKIMGITPASEKPALPAPAK
ncbi:DsbC family protein [Endozoicomonas montiporae]|uniref:Thiol:disulfide interchange protein n=1 Tax=Endozoicomonas montiporae CL-33 TaxID=570277 RepID=A0A142BBE8_9GAMM|nr:DsbC family protein [Endozoicomonas montiporae]AMO56074.1 protein-disulfide isomerase [Endozoicomonas montiporae CL-33]